MEEKEVKQNKKTNSFRRFMHIVFVNNIWYKLFALGFGIIVWLLVVGLGI